MINDKTWLSFQSRNFDCKWFPFEHWFKDVLSIHIERSRTTLFVLHLLPKRIYYHANSSQTQLYKRNLMYTTAVLIAHTFLWYVKIDLLYISPLLIKCISLNTHKLHLFHGKTFTKLSLSVRTGRSLYKMIVRLFVTFSLNEFSLIFEYEPVSTASLHFNFWGPISIQFIFTSFCLSFPTFLCLLKSYSFVGNGLA